MTHHGNEHVDENDDNGDMVRCEEEDAHTLHDRRGVVGAGEGVLIETTLVHGLLLVLDLHTINAHQAEHRPE